MFAKVYIYSVKHYNVIHRVIIDVDGKLYLSNLYYNMRLNIHDESFNITVTLLFRFSRLSQSLTIIIYYDNALFS